MIGNTRIHMKMEVTYLVIRENVRIDIAVLLVYIKNKITFNLNQNAEN